MRICDPCRVSGDMVHKNKAYGTTPGDAVVAEVEGFDSSLKSDTAQQIIQQWIEVWCTDSQCQFSTTSELWRFCFTRLVDNLNNRL